MQPLLPLIKKCVFAPSNRRTQKQWVLCVRLWMRPAKKRRGRRTFILVSRGPLPVPVGTAAFGLSDDVMQKSDGVVGVARIANTHEFVEEFCFIIGMLEIYSPVSQCLMEGGNCPVRDPGGRSAGGIFRRSAVASWSAAGGDAGVPMAAGGRPHRWQGSMISAPTTTTTTFLPLLVLICQSSD